MKNKTNIITIKKIRKFFALFLSGMLLLSILLSVACSVTEGGDDYYPLPPEVLMAYQLIVEIPNTLNPRNREVFEEAFDSAELAFNNLSLTNQSLVDNRARLTEARGQLSNFYKNSEAARIENLIMILRMNYMPLTYEPGNGDMQSKRDSFSTALTTIQSAFNAAANFVFRGNTYNIQGRIGDSNLISAASNQLTNFDTTAENFALVSVAINLISAPILQQNITVANRAEFLIALNAAQSAFDNLNSTQQSQVHNRDRLNTLLVELTNFDRQVARNSAIIHATGLMQALYDLMPLVYQVGIEQQQEYNAFVLALGIAEAAFNALETFTFAQEEPISLQAYVADNLVQALEKAAIQAEQFRDGAGLGNVVGTVIALINAPILQETITTENREAFYAALNLAQTAYSNLAVELRVYVTNSYRLEVLTANLVNFDRITAQNGAIAHTESLIQALYNLMPLTYQLGIDQTAEYNTFVLVLSTAHTAFNSLAEFVFNNEAPRNIQNYVHAGLRQALIDADMQLQDFRDGIQNGIDDVAAVIELINAAILQQSITSEKRDVFATALASAQNAYNRLNPELQTYVTNSYRLSIFTTNLTNFDRIAAQGAAIATVEGLIETLYGLMPLIYIIGVEQTEELGAFTVALNVAEAAFNALAAFVFRAEAPRNIQNYISQELQQVLIDANRQVEAFIYEMGAGTLVAAVIELINASILQEEITAENRNEFAAALSAANTAYNNLHSSLRGYVTNSYRLPILIAALDSFDRGLLINALIGNFELAVIALYALMPLVYYFEVDQIQEYNAFTEVFNKAQSEFDNLAAIIFAGETVNIQSYVPANLVQILLDATEQLADFRFYTAKYKAIDAVGLLITEFYALMPIVYEAGVDQTEEFSDFIKAFFTAQAAFDALITFVFDGEIINIQRYVGNDFRRMLADAQNQRRAFEQAAAITNVESIIQLLLNEMPFTYTVGVDQSTDYAAFNILLTNAQAAYNALATWVFNGEEPRNIQNLVGESFRNALTNAPGQLTIFNQEVQHTAAVNAVIGLINAQILLDAITTATRGAFVAAQNAAQTAYNNLARDDLRARVTNSYRFNELATKLLDFDRAEFIRTEVVSVETLINAIPTQLLIGGNRQAFVNALTAAQNAYQALASLTFNSENLPDARGDVAPNLVERLENAPAMLEVFDSTSAVLVVINRVSNVGAIVLDYNVNGWYVDAIAVMAARSAFNSFTVPQLAIINVAAVEQIVLNAEARVAELQGQVAANIPAINAWLEGITVHWDSIAAAESFIVRYDFISYVEDSYSENAIEHTVATPFYTTNLTNGFITNFRIMANLISQFYSLTTRQGFLQVALSQTPTELKNQTFLVSNGGLQAAFVSLTTNTTEGRNRNEIMAFMADNALAQVSNYAAVNAHSRGLSSVGGTLLGAGNMNRLDVGSDTLVNFNPDGSVYNSYRLIYASPYGPSIARNAAERRDRVFFDSSTNMVHSQLVNPDTSVANGNRAPETRPVWHARNHALITPYGFFGYILNPAFIGIGNSANMGSHGELNIGTVNRQTITHNTSNNTFTFTVAFNGPLAGNIIRHEHVRSGGIADVTYRATYYLALAFTICALTLNIQSVVSSSRYTADSGMGVIGMADTRVRTTTNFTFYDSHLTLPWTGDHAAPMPTWAQLGARNPGTASCLVEGTLVTLANGSQVPVETLNPGDMLLVWNFYTGKLDVAPILTMVSGEEVTRQIIRLDFDDGNYVDIYYAHGFFNKTLGSYSRISLDNAHEFIGHKFMTHNSAASSISYARLINVSTSLQRIRVFNPMTAYHLNAFANGLLMVGACLITHGFVNLFEVNPYTMSFDVEAREAVIKEFGILVFEDFDAILPGLPREFFYAHAGQYLGISIAKGITTWEAFIEFVIGNLDNIPMG